MKRMMLIMLTLALLSAPACAQNPLTLVGTYSAEGPENYFGGSMTCGDFNGDGYDEFIIGAWGWNDYMGKNYIYLGGPEFPTQPIQTIQGQFTDEEYSLAGNMGDISGDGIDDFAMAANALGYMADVPFDVYFGSADLDTVPDWTYHSPLPSSFYIRWDADSCGDVNSDGGTDFVVIVHSPEYDSVFIFWGGAALDTLPDWRKAGGSYVDGLGDVNGDGFADVMVRDYQGPARIYFGGSPMDTIPDVVFDDGQLYKAIGAGIRDLNGDGFNDLALCWQFPDTVTRYDLVYLGSSNFDTEPDFWLIKWNGDSSGSKHEILCGDFNGDARGDIISTPAYGFYTDGVQIHLGAGEFNGFADAFVTGWSPYEFGGQVAAGDINGDGRDELLVCALNYSWFYAGWVYLYQGPGTWIDYGVGSIEPSPHHEYPALFSMAQNFPNPFNSSTAIFFALARPTSVNLAVFDLQGRPIIDLLSNKTLNAGDHEVIWSGQDQQNRALASGIYLARLKSESFSQTIKMVLVR